MLQKPIVFSGSIDSTQAGVLTSDVRLPASFSGSLSTDQLQLTLDQSSTNQCTSKLEPILGDVRPTINAIPANLSIGATWSDSVTTPVCSGEKVAALARIKRDYVFQGPREVNGRQVLEIRRTDKTHLLGDGSQGQHQLHIEGEGTGTMQLMIDPVTGTLVTMQNDQRLQLHLTGSGRTQNFLQSTQQTIELVR